MFGETANMNQTEYNISSFVTSVDIIVIHFLYTHEDQGYSEWKTFSICITLSLENISIFLQKSNIFGVFETCKEMI